MCKDLHVLCFLILTAISKQVIDNISGDWNLAMTDDEHILAIMDAVNALPLVTLGDITQKVDVENGTVVNNVQLAAPMPFSLSASVPWQVQRAQKSYRRFPAAHNSTTNVSTPHILEGLHSAAMGLCEELLVAAPMSTLLQLLQDVPTSKTKRQVASSDMPCTLLSRHALAASSQWKPKLQHKLKHVHCVNLFACCRQ